MKPIFYDYYNIYKNVSRIFMQLINWNSNHESYN